MLFAANLSKIPSGGWFPLAAGAAPFIVMTTWQRGRELAAADGSGTESLEGFLRRALDGPEPVSRVRGTAVFPGTVPGTVPAALRSEVRHNGVLHDIVIVFANVSESAPRVDDETRTEVRAPGHGCYEIVTRHGFVEHPDLPALLDRLGGRLGEWAFKPKRTTFFLPRDAIMKGRAHGRMARWREALFGPMSYHPASSAGYDGLRAEDVVELGVQVTL